MVWEPGRGVTPPGYPVMHAPPRQYVSTVPVLLALTLLVWLPALADGGDERSLLVTVDDLPIATGWLHPDPQERVAITRRLLDTLELHGIRAVGLVTWSNVRSPDDLALLAMWLEAGHELGNHSFSHPDYNRTDVEDYIADVERARAELADFLEAFDRTPRFFRFPQLHEGDTAAKLEHTHAFYPLIKQEVLGQAESRWPGKHPQRCILRVT